MFGKDTAVMAIFDNESDIRKVIDELKNTGFRTSDVSVLIADSNSSKDFAHVKESKAPEGATAGAATGAVVGGTLGWLAGAGALALTGFGPLIAAGPILAALAGVGVGGAVGSLTGSLIGLGIPEYEAKRFDGLIRSGKALISVHCDDANWVTKANRVLKECGGQDIGSRREEPTAMDWTNTLRPLDVPVSRAYETEVNRNLGL